MNHDDLRHWSKRAADWAHDYHAGLRDRPVRARTAPGADRRAAARQRSGRAGADGHHLRRFRDASCRDGHDPLAAPPLLRLFPRQRRPRLDAGRTARQRHRRPGDAVADRAGGDRDRGGDGRSGCARPSALPAHFTGTIHDSATTATLCAVLTMRERALDWAGLQDGLSGQPRLRIYASAETHSSVDKAVRIAGIGQDNLVKIPTDAHHAMKPGALLGAIAADRAAGHLPAGVILCRRRHLDRRLRPDRRRRRGRPGRGALYPCRCRLGRLGDDLPRVPPALGRRGRRRLGRLQPAQMARRAVRLRGPVPRRPRAADSHARAAARPILETLGADGDHQFQRMDGPPRAAVSGR